MAEPVGAAVYRWLQAAAIGGRAFGAGPFEGDALVVEHLSGATRLQFTLSPRVATVDLLPTGELRGTLPQVEEGDNDAPWPLVISKNVQGTLVKPTVRLQPTDRGDSSNPRGDPVELAYCGPRDDAPEARRSRPG